MDKPKIIKGECVYCKSRLKSIDRLRKEQEVEIDKQMKRALNAELDRDRYKTALVEIAEEVGCIGFIGADEWCCHCVATSAIEETDHADKD